MVFKNARSKLLPVLYSSHDPRCMPAKGRLFFYPLQPWLNCSTFSTSRQHSVNWVTVETPEQKRRTTERSSFFCWTKDVRWKFEALLPINLNMLPCNGSTNTSQHDLFQWVLDGGQQADTWHLPAKGGYGNRACFKACRWWSESKKKNSDSLLRAPTPKKNLRDLCRGRLRLKHFSSRPIFLHIHKRNGPFSLRSCPN